MPCENMNVKHLFLVISFQTLLYLVVCQDTRVDVLIEKVNYIPVLDSKIFYKKSLSLVAVSFCEGHVNICLFKKDCGQQ